MVNSLASTFTIGDIAVRQLDGLFSLSDLHAASGSAKRHEPSRFTRLANTQELVNELGASPEMGMPLRTVNDGTNNGTYACRELVIAYAAWISAAFHLKVIRVFLAQQAQPALPMTDKTDAAIDTANAVSSQVHAAVFKAIMAGNTWAQSRWLVSFVLDSKPVLVEKIEPEAIVMSLDQLAQAIVEPHGMWISKAGLANLASACYRRLFTNASNNPNKGYGREVADKMKTLGAADLYEINVASNMEVYLRTL